MTFIFPAWLALFAPFAALVWWTLRGTPTTLLTTSAFLWPTTSIASAARARRVPPAWTIATLFALASAIVALASPARRGQASVAVVVDPSYRTIAASDVLNTLARRGLATTLVVPGQPEARSLADVRSTARSTVDDVVAVVARLRREGRDVIVVSDASIAADEHVRVVASSRGSNASIERLGARSVDAGADVFVRVVRTIGSADRATLTVQSGVGVATQPIEWHADATSADAFVRLASAADAIEARVTMAGDAVALDDVARLTRDAASDVRVAVDGAVPASIERFAAAYARVRRVDGATTDVTLTRDARFVGRAVIVAGGASVAAGITRREADAILADVELDALPATDAAMPAGFAAIAWRGGRPIVATRDVAGRRGVWLAIDADAAARDAAFVVLLDRAIAWSGGGDGAGWSAVPSDDVPRVGWRATHVDAANVDASPGVYVDADGRPRAVNVPPTSARSGVGDDVDPAARIASRGGGAARSIATWPGAIAALFATAGALLAAGATRGPANLDVRGVAT